MNSFDFKKYDLFFLGTFLDESTLIKLYAATNLMLLPYLNTQQISSGILADTVESSRVAIVTKYRYALELIHSNKCCPKGVVIGRHARGILIDTAEESVEQITKALDSLVFNHIKRIRIEKQTHQRGYQMKWQNSVWALLQHIAFVKDGKEIVKGRGVKFKREKKSKY